MIMRAEGRYSLRITGFVAEWHDQILHVKSKQNKVGRWLNQTATLIWFLSDGQTPEKDIIIHLQSCYPDQSLEIVSDVGRAIIELQNNGLISVTNQPSPARPLIKVGFAGFGSGFLANDNYFLWMLTYKFDIVLVNSERDLPDLLFYRSPPRERFDHRQIDRTQALKILVCADDHLPDFSECDYAFSSKHIGADYAGVHYHLPSWCYYLDWDAYKSSTGGLYDKPLANQFMPEQVCAHLYDAFFKLSQSEPNEEPRVTEPDLVNLQTTAFTNALPVAPKKLTVGMATYDDYDGVYFTIQSIRLHHPEVREDIEFLIIDNHPEGECAQPLQQLAKSISGCRYVAQTERKGTATRDLIFQEAKSDYVLCVDSHVLLSPGSISLFITFLDDNPDCHDLLQGPLVYDDLMQISTHFESVWSQGMYGKWALDERGNHPGNEPFEISMQGLGIFGCRTKSWLGFNPRFSGFGGEEGYIHEKFRQAGYRTLCLPFLRWNHRFQRPFGTLYRNTWEDRIRNYYIGHHELGLDTATMDEHFQSILGATAYERIRQSVVNEISNPFHYFDAIYCINLDMSYDRWQAMQQRFEELGIAHRVRRFSAIETPDSHQIGCALSHRIIIERAYHQGFQNVLVFEDDAVFLDKTLHYLDYTIQELKLQPWKIFYLGGHLWGNQFPKAEGCQFLESPSIALTCSHAVAYNASMYEKILDDLPDTIESMRQWLFTHKGIDQYFRNLDRRYLAFPVVSSQPPILHQEDDEYCHHFTV
jgi:hypothetical protein